MPHKATRRAEVTGCGAGGVSRPGIMPDMVTMSLNITDPRDEGRPVIAHMTPDMARHWSALLTKMADMVDARRSVAEEGQQ